MSLRSLKDDAWAESVARVRRSIGGDLAGLDYEFLEQHKAGGDVICHENGALVGVFYVAPGWQHAEEFATILAHTPVDEDNS